MPQKPKILICGILPPPYFGHSMMYECLMKSDFVNAFDITFLNLHFWSYGTDKKVTFGKIFKMITYLFQYIFLILTKRPDYILYNMSFYRMPFPKDYLFCSVGHCLGVKIILHDHGQYLPELFGSVEGSLKRMLDHMLQFTTAIIVMGQKVRKDYQPFIDPHRLIVVPGVVSDTVSLDVPRWPKDPMNSQEIKVLYFSYLSVSKGFKVALQTIPQVIAKNPNIKFIFGGPIESPELEEYMYEFIKKNKLLKHVSYVGYVGDEIQRAAYFRNTDIFIFPTLRDVFGLVILHAMAESKPVIASREGTIPEIIVDEKSGFLFDKGNDEQLAQRILQLASDERLRQSMGEEGRRIYLKRFALEAYGQLMMNAIKEIQQLPSR